MTLKLIQAGLGGWGQNWYKSVVCSDKRVKVAGFVEKVPAAAKAASEAMGIPQSMVHRSIADALKASEAEAVLITANLPGHGPLVRAALEAGLHVLVEKPFVGTVREAQELAALAGRKKRVLMVSQNYRFYPAVRAVERLVKSGTLGGVSTVAIDFRKYSNNGDPKRKHYHITEPLLLDMAVHQMDLLRCVLGSDAREIICRPSNPRWSKFDEPPAASALISFSDGVVVNYRGSWIAHEAPTTWAGEWTIECEKGAIHWRSRGDSSNGGESVTIRKEGGKGEKRIALPKLRYIDRSGALDAFIQAVRSGKTPETSARDNINTLKLVYSTIAASRTGKVVRLS